MSLANALKTTATAPQLTTQYANGAPPGVVTNPLTSDIDGNANTYGLLNASLVEALDAEVVTIKKNIASLSAFISVQENLRITNSTTAEHRLEFGAGKPGLVISDATEPLFVESQVQVKTGDHNGLITGVHTDLNVVSGTADVYARAVVQPALAFPYALNDTGLLVDSFSNTDPLASMKGIVASNITATEGASGVEVDTVTSVTGSASGVAVRDVEAGTDASESAVGVKVEGTVSAGALGLTAQAPAYGLSLSRAGTSTKAPSAAGLLAKLVNGSLGLAVQTTDGPDAVTRFADADGGNVIIVEPTPLPVTLTLRIPGTNPATGSYPVGANFEDGTWFLICRKDTGAPVGDVDVQDNSVANTINGGAGPATIPGASQWGRILMVFHSGNWYVGIGPF